MPSYDYRCRSCDAAFEVRRAISSPAVAVVCPQGHPDTTRIFSAVAVAGMANAPGAGAAPVGGGGGCCGGGCCG